MDKSRYGNRYYCVKVPSAVSPDGEIYAHADKVEFMRDGTLVFLQYLADETPAGFRWAITLALAPGKWHVIFAASHLDGGAVSVEHWKGEVPEAPS